MRDEKTARERYAAWEKQARRLDAGIRILRRRVRASGPGGRADLEQLADARRRAIAAPERGIPGARLGRLPRGAVRRRQPAARRRPPR